MYGDAQHRKEVDCVRRTQHDNGVLRKILIQLQREGKISPTEHLKVLARTPWIGETKNGSRNT